MHWYKKIRNSIIAVITLLSVIYGDGFLAQSIKAEVIDNSKFILVIDPGHGGKDAGAVDNGQKEKDINLAVGKELSQLIKKKLKNVDVVMTRDNDSYLTLQERASTANHAKGDLFISIHTNSVDKSNKNRNSVCGSSVYALGLHKDDNNMEVARRENSVIELESNYTQRYSGFDPNKDESYIIFEMAQKKNLQSSIRFAKEAQKQLVAKAGRHDRGVHQAGFWVLWATSMPSVLVELDFICNPDQASYLGSDKGTKELAESLFEAVKSFVNTYDKGSLKKNGSKKDSKTNKEVGERKDSNEPSELSDVSTMLLPTSQTSDSRKDSKTVEKDNSNLKNSRNGIESKRQEYAQRRRRSVSSRQKSENRNLEVADIPLHTANERLATPVAEESQSTYPQLSPKEQAKREKAERKAAEKARKAAEKAKKEAEKKQKRASKAKKGGHFETVYKIQILASRDQLKPNNPRFRGLSPVTMFRENNFYKYTYGEFQTKAEAETLLKQVKTKIPDAFIIEATRQKE